MGRRREQHFDCSYIGSFKCSPTATVAACDDCWRGNDRFPLQHVGHHIFVIISSITTDSWYPLAATKVPLIIQVILINYMTANKNSHVCKIHIALHALV